MPDSEELEYRWRMLIGALEENEISLSDIREQTGISSLDMKAFCTDAESAETLRHEEVIFQVFGISIAGIIAEFASSATTPNHLPVTGILRAGAWLESIEFETSDSVPVLPDLRFAARDQFVMQVQGPSMNELVSHGDYVHCVDWQKTEFSLEDEMIVVVQRQRQGLTESTLRQVAISKEGDINLVSRSSDERHQPPIPLTPDQVTDDGCSVVIQAMVIGHFQPFH